MEIKSNGCFPGKRVDRRFLDVFFFAFFSRRLGGVWAGFLFREVVDIIAKMKRSVIP